MPVPIPVPLKNVEMDVKVVNFTAEVKVSQRFVNCEKTKPDIFEIRVGQLFPGAVWVVSLTCLMELPVEERKTRLTIPTTFYIPRYIPIQDSSDQY